MDKKIKLILAVLVLVLLIVLARYFELHLYFDDLRSWVEAQGVFGPIIFMGIYIVATVFALPGSALTIMAGALFGSVLGSVTVLVSATIGASLCFLIARYFARDFVKQQLDKNEKFQKLDRLTEKNGAIIVAITRLVPLFPFNLLNYGFGLTNVPFRTYVSWSALCMLPGTILYVVGTDAVLQAVEHGEIPYSLLIVVILILVILSLVMKKAKQAIKE